MKHLAALIAAVILTLGTGCSKQEEPPAPTPPAAASQGVAERPQAPPSAPPAPPAAPETAAPVAEIPEPAIKDELIEGQKIYAKSCAACHSIGIAGAPKVGDVPAWKSRIAQGMETLVDRSINGFQGASGVMPARGGNPELTDAQVRAAVIFMLEKSR